ncbi:TIGR03617 family F420-dependent LLM class oxidoreductase [Solwaraspora sp. WMMD1047]|uniref:TIGR03617 family F420-dependent LLM class oxidoreductase n=1 Tax=Solwaraspora sp. WMMD1047 TaxID=3016102 RepID=UPI002416E59D|nr:TIGR03617 family F420-dependent LLM class oxidoreductase [Solwaraspora sp. WMMD1047]MDG4834325.1 TIGR03617 family F420-dependent LLM class oxidoreductase [Solwaraspora sp. WMMD1047]
MRIDLALTEGGLAEAAAAGQAAARHGFGRVWTTETTSDPFLLAHQALHHGAPGIGTAIAVAFARTPMATAYPAWDLAAASDGRFTLGLGSQVKAHIERRFAMPWSAPVPRMRDYVGALRAIWAAWRTGEKLAYEGEFYRHTLMSPVFAPKPHDHRIPVGIAGVGPLMTRLAGEIGDQLVVHPFTTVEYFDQLTAPALTEGLRRGGRTRADIQVYATLFIAVGETDEQLAAARETARSRLAFYASTPSYQPVLASIGYGDLQPALHGLAARGEWDQMGALLDDDVLDRLAVSGKPAAIAAEVRQRWGDRLDRVSIYGGLPALSPAGLADVVAGFERAAA